MCLIGMHVGSSLLYANFVQIYIEDHENLKNIIGIYIFKYHTSNEVKNKCRFNINVSEFENYLFEMLGD